MCVTNVKEWAEIAKNFAEALGIIVGGGYFLYRSSRGAFTHNLSLCVECTRTNIPRTDSDCLTITAKLSKGERFTVELHDAQVRVRWPKGDQTLWPTLRPDEIESNTVSQTRHLSELERKHTKKEKIQAKGWKGQIFPGRFLERRRIDLTHPEPAWVDPFLRLTPGEQTQFSCWLAVPHTAVCTVELIVLGKRAWPAWLSRRGKEKVLLSRLERGSKKVPQWRASAVSAPLEKAAG